jgi:hypothetical protein
MLLTWQQRERRPRAWSTPSRQPMRSMGTGWPGRASGRRSRAMGERVTCAGATSLSAPARRSDARPMGRNLPEQGMADRTGSAFASWGQVSRVAQRGAALRFSISAANSRATLPSFRSQSRSMGARGTKTRSRCLRQAAAMRSDRRPSAGRTAMGEMRRFQSFAGSRAPIVGSSASPRLVPKVVPHPFAYSINSSARAWASDLLSSRAALSRGLGRAAAYPRPKRPAPRFDCRQDYERTCAYHRGFAP